jgi:hypothetical protein
LDVTAFTGDTYSAPIPITVNAKEKEKVKNN